MFSLIAVAGGFHGVAFIHIEKTFLRQEKQLICKQFPRTGGHTDIAGEKDVLLFHANRSRHCGQPGQKPPVIVKLNDDRRRGDRADILDGKQ